MRLRPLGSVAAAALLVLAALAAPWLPAADAPTGVIVLKGHRENVFGIAFAPDGKLVVTASGDPSVRVWDAATGKVLKVYEGGPEGHKQLVLAVAVHPDGSQFATGGGDNSAKLWDMPTSSPLKSIALASDPSAVAVSPDGKTVASAGADGKARLHSVEGKLLHELSGAGGAVRSLAFSPTGTLVSAVSSDGVLRTWNVADGKLASRFAAHPGDATGLGYSPNQAILYTAGSDGLVKYWTTPFVAPKDLATGGAVVRSMSVAMDSTVLAFSSGKTVRLASLTNGEPKGTFTLDAEVTSAAAGGGFVAAGTPARDVVLWKQKEDKIVARLPAHDGAVTGVAVNAGGNFVATSGKDGIVRLWNLPIAPTRKLATAAGVTGSVLLADGKRVVTAGADKVVRFYKLDGALERQLTGHKGAIRAVAVAPDGKTVASAGDSGNLRIWSSKADTANVIGAHEGAVVSLAYVGDRVLSASVDGSIKLWQPAVPTGKGALSHAGAVLAAALSVDGARLATVSDDRQVRLWGIASGKMERTYAGPSLAVSSVAWSRAGDRIAAGSADKSVWVWESNSAKEVRKLTNLPAAVRAVGLPVDGKHVLAGLGDGSTRLFDLATGKEAKSFPGPKAVTGLVLPAKGDSAVIGYEDGTVATQLLAGGAPKTWKAAGPVAALAVKPDSTAVAVGSGKGVEVFALDGKSLAKVATPAGVRGLAYSADGKRLAVAGDDGKARTYDAEGHLEEQLAHEGAVNAVAFTTDGRQLISAGADKMAHVRPLSLVWQARAGAAATQAVVAPRGVVATLADGTVGVFNIADGKRLLALRAHAGPATSLAVAGDKLATLGSDGTARYYDLAKVAPGKPAGKEIDAALQTIKLPAAGISVSLSPNATRLAVGVPAGKGQAARIHDPVTGQLLASFDDGSASVLAWQADNRTLLMSGEDKQVRLVDVPVAAAFDAHAGGVATIAFSPTVNMLLSAGADKTAKLWNLGTLKLERAFGPVPEVPAAAAFSRDGTQVAVTAGKKAHVFTLADAKPLMEFSSPAVLGGVAYNADKTRLMAAGADGRARVWDLATKREAFAFLHEGAVTAAAWHPFSPALAFTAGEDKQAHFHSAALARLVDAATPLRSLAVSGNGTFVAVGGDDGKLRRYNPSNAALEKDYPVGEKAVTAVGVSRNEQLIAAAGADAKLRVFGSGDGKLLSIIALVSNVRAITFTPDNRTVLAVPEKGPLVAIDVQYPGPGQPVPEAFGRVVQTYTHPGDATAAAFAKEGNAFWTSGGDKSVKGWKLASETPTRNLSHPSIVNSVSYSKDGGTLLTGCSDGRLRLFDVAKGTQTKQVDAHTTVNNTAIYCVAVSADGKLAATACIDQTAKVWSVPAGSLVREIKGYKEKAVPDGHKDAVLTVAFSPDGKQIVTGSMDQTVKVWNVADGRLVREFANPAYKGFSHPGWVYAVRWTSDGKHILSAGAAPRLKGYVAVWEAATGKLVDGQESDGGTIFSLALSKDEKSAGLGRGGSIRPDSDVHSGTIFKIPGR